MTLTAESVQRIREGFQAASDEEITAANFAARFGLPVDAEQSGVDGRMRPEPDRAVDVESRPVEVAWSGAVPSSAELAEIQRENMRNAWAALRMIRKAIETLGPPGILPSEEEVLRRHGPMPVHEAEVIVAALQKLFAGCAP